MYVCVCVCVCINYLASNGLYIVMVHYINDLYILIGFSYTKKKEKKAHKYKIIQTLSSSNFIYRVKYMIKFFMVCLYWTPYFLH